MATSLNGLDGYEVELRRAEMDRYRPIIAIAVNGKPMAIGGLGPAKLMFPETGDAERDEIQKSKGVWALFHIKRE